MSRTLAIILASVLVASLTAATYSLSTKNTEIKETVDKQTETIVNLEEKTVIQQERIEELEAQIVVLNNRIKELEGDLKVYKKQIKEEKAKIKRRNATIDKLSKEIEALARAKKDNSAKINKLEAEKKLLKESLGKHDANVFNLEKDEAEKIKALEEQKRRLAEQKLKEARLARISNIVQHTQVVFEKIEARERKESGTIINKIKNKKWRYTNIQFHLQHKNGRKDIMDENFAVLIRDIDSGKILPFNEGNPKHPGKKVETGCPLTFNGNMFMVDYFNNEVKNGKNYAVEIYYVLNDERFPIPNGTKKIVIDGKFVK